MRRVLLFLLLAGLFLSGCATRSENHRAGRESGFLGLVKVEDDSFVPPREATFALAESEVVSNTVRTGRKVSLLWGLITYTDY